MEAERQELEEATALSQEAAHKHTNALTAEALLRSKEESMVASCSLKSLGIVQFRLTRCARRPELQAVISAMNDTVLKILAEARMAMGSSHPAFPWKQTRILRNM